ncbi:MAG TPA: AAA family ATPase [Acidimicrobiia bacterium]|nr:AAA family ATPase [Acidimicrobiia bacterium]
MTEVQRGEVIGRRGELAALDQARRDAARGTGRVVLVSGEPGIGKTRLAEEAARRAGDEGFVVAWASCWDGDGAPALWPWLQVLDALGAATTVGVDPAGADRDEGVAGAARFPVYAAVLEAIEDACSRLGPLLVVIDDLHWADDDSAALLGFVALRLRSLPAMIVATFRPDEIGSRQVAALTRVAEALALDGLSTGEVEDLMEAVTGQRPSTSVATDLRDRCDGNPLFVREMSRLLAARPEASPDTIPVPGGVRVVLERRLARVAQPTVDVLEVVSVLGTAASIPLVVDVAGEDPAVVLDQLESAQRAGLVEVVGDEVRFTHALVRDVVYEGVGGSRRAELHREAAAVLERGGRDDDWAAVAHHWQRSGAHDERAASASRRAADRAKARRAFADAAGHYERAAELFASLAADDPGIVDAQLEQADMLFRAGRPDAARGVYFKVAEGARAGSHPVELARAALGLGAGLSGFEVSLNDVEQVALLEEALAVLPADATAMRAAVMARLAVAGFFVERIDPRALATESVRLARAAGDVRTVGYALSALCDSIAGPEHAEERMTHADEIISIGRDVDTSIELLGRRLRMRGLLEVGDLLASDVEIGAYARVAGRLRQPLYDFYVPLWRGMRALTYGRLGEVAAFVAETTSIGAAASSVNSEFLSATLDSWRALFAGEPALEIPHAEDFLDMIDRSAGLAAGLTWSAFHRGEPERAQWFYEHAAADEFTSIGDEAETLVSLLTYVEVALAFGDRPRLAVLYDRMAPHADRCIVDGIGGAWLGSVHMQLARIARALGRDAARDHIRVAMEVHARANAPFFELLAGTIASEWGVARSPTSVAGTADEPQFRRSGDGWLVAWSGEPRTVADSKGMRDIAVLLAHPGVDVHVSDLTGGRAGVDRGTGEVLDRRAREEYRRRLADLDAELAEAESNHDRGRVEKARVERDFLVAELSAAVGLGGRPRVRGDDVERARKAVAARIKQAIDRLESVDTRLGRHLRHSIRTGTRCAYEPEHPTDWCL